MDKIKRLPPHKQTHAMLDIVYSLHPFASVQATHDMAAYVSNTHLSFALRFQHLVHYVENIPLREDQHFAFQDTLALTLAYY